jgi:hypothetical protein
MASRTKQKEETRARRRAEERAGAEQARRQRLFRMIGGIVLGALVVVAIAIAVSSGGGKSSATGLQSGTRASQTQTQVNSLLSGIPQSGAVLGNPSAKVTVDYYGDLHCRVCRDVTLDSGWPQMVANEVRQGRVKVSSTEPSRRQRQMNRRSRSSRSPRWRPASRAGSGTSSSSSTMSRALRALVM